MRRTRAGNSVPKSSQREKPRFIALLGVALLQRAGPSTRKWTMPSLPWSATEPTYLRGVRPGQSYGGSCEKP